MMQSQDQSIIPSDITCSLSNGRPVVSSLAVAEVFGKEHYNVLRDIRDLGLEEIDPEFNALNFEVVEYEDAKGEARTAYNLTEEGFSLLVMGYRGESALRFKIAFIKEFVRMRSELKQLAIKEATHAILLREGQLAHRSSQAAITRAGMALDALVHAMPSREDQKDLCMAYDALGRVHARHIN